MTKREKIIGLLVVVIWLEMGVLLVFFMGCGSPHETQEDAQAISALTPSERDAFEAAKVACGTPDAQEPTVEHYPAIRCNTGSTCCVVHPTWGSYYDYERHAVVLPEGDASCNAYTERRTMPCEMENACTCDHAYCVDRCVHPC